jgi:hypothetical protein
VSLLKDVLNDPGARTCALDFAWLAFGVSVGCGLWFLLALTGSLGSNTVTDSELSVYSSNARIPMFVQVFFFLLGLTGTIVFGITEL